MAAQSKPAAAGRKQLRALAVASGGFYLTFAAWGLMENLISTYYQRLGYYSMSLVYFGIGPSILSRALTWQRGNCNFIHFLPACCCFGEKDKIGSDAPAAQEGRLPFYTTAASFWE